MNEQTPLDKCLSEANISNRDFARQIQRTESFVSKLRKGKANPSLYLSVVISGLLSWKVSPLDLIVKGTFVDFLNENRFPMINPDDFISELKNAQSKRS